MTREYLIGKNCVCWTEPRQMINCKTTENKISFCGCTIPFGYLSIAKESVPSLIELEKKEMRRAMSTTAKSIDVLFYFFWLVGWLFVSFQSSFNLFEL